MAALTACAFALPSVAHAQVRYDLGALASFDQRFVGEGGALTLDGHVALVPLLRVGGWVTGEVSKQLDASSARAIMSFGARIKIVPPWPRGAWRAWIATGFGYDGVIADHAGGGFFEVPAIVGASYRIRKPLVFLMELGAHFGFASWGSYYDHADADVVSLALSVGLGIE